VLVHRREWVRDKVADGLERGGVRVVALLDNGADAVGVAVVEQPDLLLVEDALPMCTGSEVIREVRTFSARTRIAAQVAGDVGLASVLEAGAEAAFTRRVPPADIARALLDMVRQPCP
jgi:DNA-binding NarL/FixJ family response regulator